MRWPEGTTRLAVAALVAAVAAAGCGGTSSAEESVELHVDKRSLGGACSDALELAQVTGATPLCSIGRALELAPEGATISVRGGRYPRLELRDRDKPVTLAAANPAERTVLDGLTVARARNVRVSGFRIKNTVEMETVSDIALVGNNVSPNDITIGGASRLLIEGNNIHHLTIVRDPSIPPAERGVDDCVPRRCGYGLRFNRVRDSVIRGNRFVRIPADGIQMFEVRRIAIEGNRFERIEPFVNPEIHSDAIQVLGNSDRIALRGNSFRLARGPLFQNGTHDRTVVESNLMADLRSWGIKLINSRGARIANNTVWNASAGIVMAGRTQGAAAFNNLTSSLQGPAAGFSRRDHNLVMRGLRDARDPVRGRPLFRDPASGDYRLRRGSAGIDSGTSDGAPEHDLDGRPRAGPPDLGAFEFR